MLVEDVFGVLWWCCVGPLDIIAHRRSPDTQNAARVKIGIWGHVNRDR